jgi:hypothetical protein
MGECVTGLTRGFQGGGNVWRWRELEKDSSDRIHEIRPFIVVD